MKITKLEHSGIVLEKSGQCLVFDPVEIETQLPELRDVVGLIITHKHGDHLQPAQIQKIVAANPTVRVLTTSDATSEVPHDFSVRNGETLKVGDFELQFFGQDHAVIVPGKIPCENLGVVVDGQVVNPGDSFDFPDGITEPEVLLVPLASPWHKIVDSMEYIQTHRPKRVIPVHDAVLSDFGRQINNNWLRQACFEVGSELVALEAGQSLEI